MDRIRIGDWDCSLEQRGTGIPLVLVHGFPLDRSMWRSQIDDLSRDYRVIAPDLRGFGQSSITPGTVTMAQYADDVAALLAALRVEEPVVFCGLSMGGYVAWQFWRRHRDRLRGMILCDTRAVADSAEAAQGRRQSAQTVLAEGPGKLVESMLPKLFAEATRLERAAIVEATRRVMLGTSPEGIAAALRGMAERPDMTPDLPQITVRALCICGEHDAIAVPAEMRGIADAMPQAEFVEICNAGHMAPLEQPAPVNAAIRTFLRQLSV